MSKTKGQINKNSSTAAPPKWYYLVLILIPVLFLAFLEIFLRIFNYGTDYTTFINLSASFPDKLFLNPDITEKYFTNLKQGPASITDGFDEEKKANCFRVFVLGGSSAAGWPYPANAAFSRYIKRRLELLYPENTIEVINCGISAINTYTIRDIVPDIIEQKPDVILIYAGHNEYYGALGVGSTAGLSESVVLTNLYLGLLEFKTTQLIRDLLKGVISFFGDEDELKDVNNETLMGRMIGESLIPFNSDTFKAGIVQFEENFSAILEYFKDAGVPVITSTLTSNLKDLRPFISTEGGEYPPAEVVYEEAVTLLKSGKTNPALEKFVEAKDLDALRFRAPAEINAIIQKKSGEFGYPVVDVYSLFNANSPDSITGYNLMVDHLHPNVEGYTIIGEEFFRKLEKANILPVGGRNDLSAVVQDSIMRAEMPYTPLDSTIAHLRILMLTGSYPFAPKGTPNLLVKNFKPRSFNDTLAAKVINKEMYWEVAHSEAAKIYYYKGQYKEYMKEIEAIIQERPYNKNAYEFAIDMLRAVNRFDDALGYLYRLHKIAPSYYTKKWIGQIELGKQNYNTALEYLRSAVKEPAADWQTWYNLAGAHFYKDQIDSALRAVDQSLKLNPSNPRAQAFRNQLRAAVR